MAMPKKRMSHKRSGDRRNNPAKDLTVVSLSVCSNCKAAVLPHHACKQCGFYNGRKVTTAKAA